MGKKWTVEQKDGYCLIHNEGGATLGVSGAGAEGILEQDGYAFKDLNRSGTLEPYEDWRLPVEERIADLAGRMTPEEIAGLMLYSSHQAISKENPLAALMYPGRKMEDDREHPWELTGDQKDFLQNDHLRHVLVAMVDDTPTAARWNNQAQALAEGLGLGIPVSISSDPRHTAAGTAEFDMGAGGDISVWPEHLGLAATFSPEVVEAFGRVASAEYRAMGITTALSPQIDLATEPRWNRFVGTFGESPALAAAMARAYCDGFQTTEGSADGWGGQSVNAMVKHWPGGGTGESGRDAHFGYGKYAVYPGDAFDEHLKPFTEGAFRLKGKTGAASAVMPYYTISTGQDKANGENVGNGYSRYIVGDLLRNKYGYDGVVCTDWNITHDPGPIDTFFGGKCWGVEDLTVARRHYKVLMAGVDQFGGNNDAGPVMEAYNLGAEEHGEAFVQERFRQSARRLLRNIMRTGLFENPYLDPEESGKTAGRADFMRAGYDAQLRSVVMLKNKKGALPLQGRKKVYIPRRYIRAGQNWFGVPTPERDVMPVDTAEVARYFDVVEEPGEADCAFCFIESPQSSAYSKDEGYLPISLQYRTYTATAARGQGLADPGASYQNKTNTTANEPDLDMVINTKKQMDEKPVVVFVRTANPFVAAELEPFADAILLDFKVQTPALMDIASGAAEPSALLPFQMPAGMEAVEKQMEDVPFDMEPYRDECGNSYDFAFGLDWAGVIADERVRRFR